ncbi:hypothetical protein GF412_05020 [Candidatus Micrarchaeota archaeon]|nr:hypothetical protein [Candidatus Micrarchaeota archaeon]MBD3418315.1 hypothetical protein [Candidatus Micrarchaeota archaeon]
MNFPSTCKSSRNIRAVMRIDGGEPRARIARSLGISRQRLNQIYAREKERSEWSRSPFSSLSTQTYRLLKKFFQKEACISSPALPDLKKFLSSTPDWENKLRLFPSFGEKRLAEAKQFFRENGLI